MIPFLIWVMGRENRPLTKGLNYLIMIQSYHNKETRSEAFLSGSLSTSVFNAEIDKKLYFFLLRASVHQAQRKLLNCAIHIDKI